MPSRAVAPLAEDRLRLLSFATAPERLRYVAILRIFDDARERSALQLSAADVSAALREAAAADSKGADAQEVDVDAALASLDQLHSWGLLERLQDDRRVRTIAEYRQRRSIYQLTEVGWVAWNAVDGLLQAHHGEAELRSLVLPTILRDLEELRAAVAADDAERTAHLLAEVHGRIDDLARHAARFLLASSELAASWESSPTAFIHHKDRLLVHLEGFVRALGTWRPQLAAAVAALEAIGPERLVALAVAGSAALDGELQAARRLASRWQAIVGWFQDAPGRTSKASELGHRTTRAIAALAELLRRVLDVTAGGVSRVTEFELLAAWFIACPDDASAHALAGLTSGARSARHLGATHDDPELIGAQTSWWSAAPATVETTLRRHHKRASTGRPMPIARKDAAEALLAARQQRTRVALEQARHALPISLEGGTPLDDDQLRVLLRLLDRALRSRKPASATLATVHGRLRLRIRRAGTDARVATARGTLVLPNAELQIRGGGDAA